MEYLTVNELAALKGCSLRHAQRIVRDGKIKAEIMLDPAIKQERYMIPVATLPDELKAKHYKKQRTGAGILPEKTEPEKPEKTAFKYGLKGNKRPIENFSANEREKISFWIDLLNEWQAERSKRKDKTEFDKIFSAHKKYLYPELNVSPDILYRKYSAYQNEFYEDLLDKRGGWNRGSSKIADDGIIWQSFLSLYLQEGDPKLSNCYRELQAYIKINYPELADQIPNEACFRRKVKTIPFAVMEYTQKGEKAMHDHCLPHAFRLKDKLHSNSIWVMDNYTFDVIVKDENDNKKKKRMYLTTVLDVKSGVLVGWNITDSPDSQSTIDALRHAMQRFGIPEYLYFDNGREFTNDAIVGEKRHRKVAESKKGNIPPTILERLKIDVIIALPTNAQAKVVERIHRTIKEQFCSGQYGYCGGNVIERPESLKRRIKNGEIETEQELNKLFSEYADYVFNVAAYGGDEVKYSGMSAIDVWNYSANDVPIKKASPEILNLLLMRSTGYQKIKREGVFINYHGEKIWYYDTHNTWKHINEEVCVRYDLNALGEVRIYDRDDRYLYSWKVADWLMAEYIAEEQENLAGIGRTKAEVRNDIKTRARELQGKIRITQKQGLRCCAVVNQDKFEIRMPKNIVPIIVNDEPVDQKKAVGAEDIHVPIDLKRIQANAAKRKGE